MKNAKAKELISNLENLNASGVISDNDLISIGNRVKNLFPSPIVKPTLGLIPKFIMEEQRLRDISDAIIRFYNAGKLIPKEWTDEYASISDSLAKKGKQLP